MKTAGIIAEYNPFHNGHKYQIQKLKEQCESIVCVMSGSFVQRGDVAVIDKFTRAKTAVENGADLVVELPCAYVLSSAQQFAWGGVNLLKMCKCDTVCFGTECENSTDIKKAADILEAETEEKSALIMKYQKEGLSYPKSLMLAHPEIADIISTPNNVLGIEYVRAMRKASFDANIYAVKRKGAGHNSTDICDNIASASAIRTKIYDGEAVSGLIPDYKLCDIRKISTLDSAIISAIRISKEDFFYNCTELSSDVISRIIRYSMECSGFFELAKKAVSKNITEAKIRRGILTAFLKINSDLCKAVPTYIRPLAMNDNGAKILGNTDNIDIISKTADYRRDNEMFNTDIRATDIASLCGQNKRGCMDFTTSPVFIK